MFGVQLLFLPLITTHIMFCLWMIVLAWVGCIFWNINLKFSLCLSPFIICCALNFMLNHKYCTLTMGGVYQFSHETIYLWPWDASSNLVPWHPQQNGIAERKNCTLLEITRALLIESYSPPSYWPEAIATATYLTNRLPSHPLKYKTPLTTLGSFVSLPSAHSLPPRIFGCVVFVNLPKQARTKLEARAIKCIFLGYGVNQKGYRCFDPIHNRMYTTMDCDFFEHSYYYTEIALILAA